MQLLRPPPPTSPIPSIQQLTHGSTDDVVSQELTPLHEHDGASRVGPAEVKVVNDDGDVTWRREVISVLLLQSGKVRAWGVVFCILFDQAQQHTEY